MLQVGPWLRTQAGRGSSRVFLSRPVEERGIEVEIRGCNQPDRPGEGRGFGRAVFQGRQRLVTAGAAVAFAVVIAVFVRCLTRERRLGVMTGVLHRVLVTVRHVFVRRLAVAGHRGRRAAGGPGRHARHGREQKAQPGDRDHGAP